jgi:methylated-DNA-protein-cysteine methyltransferase-like protein
LRTQPAKNTHSSEFSDGFLSSILISMTENDTYTRIYRVVQQIPEGKVATYGQVAALAGLPGRARQVGYALNALPEGLDIPWQRVINARGEISKRATPGFEKLQQRLLEREGVQFDSHGRVSLDQFGWKP